MALKSSQEALILARQLACDRAEAPPSWTPTQIWDGLSQAARDSCLRDAQAAMDLRRHYPGAPLDELVMMALEARGDREETERDDARRWAMEDR